MIERGRRVPSAMPRRVARLPAATLRTTTSSGMISTSRISCSRMLRRRTKWVGMPISASRMHQVFADAVVQHALAGDDALLGAVAGGGVVLEILHQGAGLRSLEQDLGFAFIELAAAGHHGILSRAALVGRQSGGIAALGGGKKAGVCGLRPGVGSACPLPAITNGVMLHRFATTTKVHRCRPELHRDRPRGLRPEGFSPPRAARSPPLPLDRSWLNLEPRRHAGDQLLFRRRRRWCRQPGLVQCWATEATVRSSVSR